MAQQHHQSQPPFKGEKDSVIGELAKKIQHSSINSRGEDVEDDLPPPPPVFQTYGIRYTEAEDSLPPPPPPWTPASGRSSVAGQPPSPPPPPPSQPLISRPDYSKLSLKKQHEPEVFVPKLQPVSQAGHPISPARDLARGEQNLPSAPQEIARAKASSAGPRYGAPDTMLTRSGPFSSPRMESSRPEKTTVPVARSADPSRGPDVCWSCKGLVEYGACTAFGRKYHQACFRCGECQKILHGKFKSRDEQPYCDICYQEKGFGEKCWGCKKEIAEDSIVIAGTNTFHSACMKCTVCGKQLTGVFYTLGQNIVCEEDYKATLETCDVCGDILSGAFYKIEGKNVCEKDYKKQLSPCARCGGRVEGKMLKVSDEVYHPACFTCSVCGKSLAGIPFSIGDKKQILCTEDYQRKFAAQCDGCGDYILPKGGEMSAERVKVQGKSFHPSCFKCQDCGLVFDSRVEGKECYPLDTSFYCMNCCLARQNQAV